MAHQPNSWSKHPGTRIEQVLAYCPDLQKYVGCIELLFCLTVTMTFGVRTWKIHRVDGRDTAYIPGIFYIKNSISWYQEIINISWYQEMISWYQEFNFLISGNRILDIKNAFLDIKNSISLYQEIVHISWYQKIEFLISRNRFFISRNVFWGAVLLFIEYFLISRFWFLDIKNSFLDWYIILDIKK